MREELDEMKKVLGQVNANIYGKKAADMCKTVAMGGKGRAPLAQVKGGGGNERKKTTSRPFKV